MKGITFGRWLVLLIVLSFITVIATVSSIALFTLANYSDTVERLVANIKIGDTVEVKNDLIRLHYFYDLSKKWKVQWWADKYLFKDAPFYELADTYLIRDWEKVMEDLKDKQDDHRSYMYGNAKFRYAQFKLYQAGKTKEALNLVLTEVASDFEKALRNCLEADPNGRCFDRVWNYDLATNKKDAEEALKNPQQGLKPKFVLGPTKEKNAPPIPIPNDKDKKGDGKEGEGKGGQGSPRKRP